MMYNRYVPDAAGVYRPTRVEDVPPPPPVQPPVPPPVPEAPPSLRRRARRCPSGRMRAASCRGCCRAASTRAIC